jgi:hypothetical protein
VYNIARKGHIMSRAKLIKFLLGSFLCVSISTAAATALAAQTLCLRASEPPAPRASLLVRELGRQALLMGAREDFGCATRDEALRENFDDAATTLSIAAGVADGEQIAITIARGATPDQDAILEQLFPLNRTGENWCVAIARVMEAASRAEFADALQKAGLKKVEVRTSDAALPPEIQRQLQEFNLFSQFAAVRALHEQIRTSGESPALLGGLVMGYMNLAEQTRFHWTLSLDRLG